MDEPYFAISSQAACTPLAWHRRHRRGRSGLVGCSVHWPAQGLGRPARYAFNGAFDRHPTRNRACIDTSPWCRSQLQSSPTKKWFRSHSRETHLRPHAGAMLSALFDLLITNRASHSTYIKSPNSDADGEITCENL